ncbi:MAG TPA: response regulator [Candidatus Eisenbacteria bacterium]|nr:response regulator [Candidatus Eisenbacteria bacterium]
MGEQHRNPASSGTEASLPRVAGRVLLAEGDVALGDLYRAALEAAGWQVVLVHDWRSTRERLLDWPPEVLVMDSLPDLSRTDALAQVRSYPATRDLAVILLTDTIGVGDLQRAQELGVQELLVKSRATRHLLSETIRRVLASRSGEASNTGGDDPGEGSGPRSRDSA